MDGRDENGTSAYYLFVGSQLSPSTVFYEVRDEEAARQLCELFTAEYDGKFQYRAPTNGSVAEEILLTEALDNLVVYDDPDPGIYEPTPSHELLLRAQYARRAAAWHELLQRRRRDDKPVSPQAAPQHPTDVGNADSADGHEDHSSGEEQHPDGFPCIDEIQPMPEEDDRNSGLILLLMLAQAYYKMLEATISMASWVTMMDLELNHSYIWTIQNLTNLLKNHKHLQDFPGTFEPVLPDLYPSTIGDLEWEYMIAPEAEGFLATVQKYVMTKGCYEPEENTPGWVMVELFRPSILRAVECAETYHRRMRAAQRKILGEPEQKQSSSSPSEERKATTFATPEGATWADVSIRFMDGETVAIKVGQSAGRFMYSEMGMIDGRNKKPTKQWDLLRAFAHNHGVVTWDKPGADRRNQKRREVLADNLRAFFQLDGEPIALTDDKKGWRTVFSIESDA